LETVELAYALDTLYFLVMGVLVMFMACGFSMLEAGLVRSKNTAEILAKNVALYAIACTMYMLVGYYVMYSSAEGGWLPSFFGGTLGAENTKDAVLASNGEIYYSKRSDFFFQVVFVATAMSIVSGAVAERMKLWAFLAFAIVMCAVIYPVQGYWHWGGGFLSANGFQDFAGSGVVHMAGASAALAGVLLLGPRKGRYGPNGEINAMPGANIPLATLGMFILWFGWFGFNGGSELKVSNIEEANAVAKVFVNTNAAAAGGVIAAFIASRLLFRTTDITMGLNGALAGLVAITADPLNPSAELSTLIGAIGGAIVVFAIITLDKLRIDDPVGAISVHGVVGVWGVLAVCISNPDATLGMQLVGIVTIFTWVFGASWLVWMAIKAVMGIRVSEEEEQEGLDITDCGLEAYPEFTGK
jgi:Amt family ammonium transporter